MAVEGNLKSSTNVTASYTTYNP